MSTPPSPRVQAQSMAEAWGRWRDTFRQQTRAGSELMVQAAELVPGMQVLDLGSGVGEPAFAFARAVGPSGKVVATDLSGDAMLALAENARSEGITTLECRQANMQDLPFEAESFDRVTGRLSLMFSPDPSRALSEVQRVLKPRGLALFVCWTEPEQPLFSTTLGVLGKYITMPIPPVGSVGPFRFATPGTLSEALTSAGFQDVVERSCTLDWPFPGPAARAWAAFADLSGPAFGEELWAMPLERRLQIEAEVVRALAAYEKDGVTDMKATVVLGVGHRPAKGAASAVGVSSRHG